MQVQNQLVDRAILEFVTEILDELTEDLDIPKVGHQQRLGDLGLESISLVYLIAEVQQAFDLDDRLLETLRAEPPIDIRELTVHEFVGAASSVRAGAPDVPAGEKAS